MRKRNMNYKKNFRWQIGVFKLKTISHFIVNFKKLKIQTTDWEKVFAEHKSDKGHGSRIQRAVKFYSPIIRW